MGGRLIGDPQRACGRMRRIVSDDLSTQARRLRGGRSRSIRLSRRLRAGSDAYPGIFRRTMSMSRAKFLPAIAAILLTTILSIQPATRAQQGQMADNPLV